MLFRSNGTFDVSERIHSAKQQDIKQATIYFTQLYEELTCDEVREIYKLKPTQLTR